MQRFAFSLVVISLLTAGHQSVAEDAVSLPAADQLFAKSAEALGGAKALKSIKTATIKGTSEIPEFGLTGPVVMNYREGELRIEIEFNGQKTIQGVTDKKGWELSPTQGARIMSESESSKLLSNVTMAAYIDPASMYKEMKTVGKKKVGDEECYQVQLVRKPDDGKEEVCFSATTFLPAQTITTRSSEFGELQIVTTLSDYQEFGNIKMPRKMSSKIEQANMTYTLNVKSAVYNEPIDDEAFTVPDDIQKLLNN